MEHHSSFDRICLSCSKETSGLCSIFSEDFVLDNNKSIRPCEMLTAITKYNMSPVNEYPDKLCSKCLQSCRNAFVFKCQIEASEQLMHASFPDVEKDQLRRKKVVKINKSSKNSTYAMQEKCRVCLNNSSKLASIYAANILGNSKATTQTLCNALEEICKHKLELADGISYKVCSKCIKCAQDALHFKRQVEAALEISMPNKVNSKKSKFDDVEHNNETSNGQDEIYEDDADNLIMDISATDSDEVEIKIEIEPTKYTEQNPIKDSTTEQQLAALKLFSCTQCSKTFKHKKSLNIHITTHSNNKTYKCDNCSKCFANQTYLNQHKVIHRAEKSFHCEQCSKSFFRSGDLKKHQVTHSVVKSYVCNVCSKAFGYSTTLQKHMATHASEKSYSCKDCSKTFAQLFNLQRHLATHSDDSSKHNCSECSKTFASRETLHNHRLVHASEKPLTCDECDERFVHKAQLTWHKAQHVTASPYKCDQCPKAYRYPNKLAMHKRIHTSENPYSCDQCEKNCHSSKELSEHMVTHSGHKAFSCDQCTQSFTRRINLEAHKKIHANDGSFKCQVCPSSFEKKLNLIRHLRNHRSLAKSNKQKENENLK